MTNQLTEIGVAHIQYGEDGRVKFAEFKPTLPVDVEDLLPQFQQLNGSTDLKAVEENAGLLLGAWFNRLNVIELAPRDQFQIATETVSCDYYPNGKLLECKLRFVFKPIP